MITIRSKVSNSKLSTIATNDIRKAIAQLEGENVEITIKRAKTKRTLPQNSFYFGCVVPIIRQGLKDLGYTMTLSETHEFLKDKFLQEELVHPETSEFIGKRTKSTTELSKGEMVEYINNIMDFSATILGIVIPEAESQTTLI